MAKKKIGVITFHHVTNEGAVLQAYSQAKAYQEVLGDEYEVEIIDYRPAVKVYGEIRETVASFVKMRNPMITLKRKYILKKFVKNQPQLSDKHLISNDLDKAIDFVKGKYHAIIAGSDELWKVHDDKLSRPFPNIYWLPPELDCLKFASAASANRFDYNSASQEKLNYMEKCLADFQLVGVRDDHTIGLAKKLNVPDNRIYKVPDPTFSLNLESDIYDITRLKLKKKGLDLSKPILSFVIGSVGKKNKICRLISKEYKDKGYQIVSMSMNNDFADFYLQDIFNPLEWGHAFIHFDLCVTDTFHGTVFCLKNKTPFLTIDHEDRYLNIKSKTTDILNDLEMMDHHFSIIKDDYSEGELFKKLDYVENKSSDYDISLMVNKYYNFLSKVKEKL